MSTGKLELSVKGGIVTGPPGLSILKIQFKEKLPNGDSIYSVIREDNKIIGEYTVPKGERGAQGFKGDKGDVGVGIDTITHVKEGLTNKLMINLTDGRSYPINVLDGENAYEIWLDLGNSGSREDFLEAFRGYALEFQWKGTELGIKSENQEIFKFVDLRGPQGPQGEPGNGIQGPQGLQGVKGDQGIQGIKGDQGLQGGLGPQGQIGPKGDQGSQGIQGVKGEQGIQGIRGLQGIKGDNGITGDKGDKGTSFQLRGAWSSAVAYVNDSNYIDLVTSGGNTYACKRSHINQAVSNTTYWELIAKKGDTGPQGNVGPQGNIGPQGPTGAQVNSNGNYIFTIENGNLILHYNGTAPNFKIINGELILTI